MSGNGTCITNEGESKFLGQLGQVPTGKVPWVIDDVLCIVKMRDCCAVTECSLNRSGGLMSPVTAAGE